MASSDQVKDMFQVLLISNIRFRKRMPLNETHDEEPVCVIDNFRRNPGGVGCTRGRYLVKSHDTVYRDVVANPDDKALVLVVDDKIGVGNAATQRFGRYT
jgi:hypothetical protein